MDLLIKHDICPLINNGFLLVFVITTCCICFVPNMSIGQTGKQPAQFCPWLFWQKTCPQMAKYKVMGTIMVITIDYLAARTKQCGIARSILWLKVHQIYSKKWEGTWSPQLVALFVVGNGSDLEHGWFQNWATQFWNWCSLQEFPLWIWAAQFQNWADANFAWKIFTKNLVTYREEEPDLWPPNL